jgi:hypothetical protein
MEIFFVLVSRLGDSETKMAAGGLVSRPGSIIVLSQSMILLLGLVEGLFGLLDFVFGGEAIGLPLFPATFHLVGHVFEIGAHLVQIEAVRDLIVGNALVNSNDFFKLRGIGALARVATANAVKGDSAKSTQFLCVVVFKIGTLLEKRGQFLVRVSHLGPPASIN